MMPILVFNALGEDEANKLTNVAFAMGLVRWKMEASAEKAEEIEAERGAEIQAWVNKFNLGGR